MENSTLIFISNSILKTKLVLIINCFRNVLGMLFKKCISFEMFHLVEYLTHSPATYTLYWTIFLDTITWKPLQYQNITSWKSEINKHSELVQLFSEGIHIGPHQYTSITSCFAASISWWAYSDNKYQGSHSVGPMAKDY